MAYKSAIALKAWEKKKAFEDNLGKAIRTDRKGQSYYDNGIAGRQYFQRAGARPTSGRGNSGGSEASRRTDQYYNDAKGIYNTALGNFDKAKGRLDNERDNAFSGAKEYRDWAKNLVGDALDTDQITADAERLTPKADADTQTFIDYAASLVSDPTSMLRRATDGDFDLTQFNQGVVAPMMRMAEKQEREIAEAYSGGDPYGKTGGSTGISGAGKVAQSNFRSALSENIAGLRYQERNNMFDRAFQGMQTLGQLGDFVDNRKYEALGMSNALDLAGKRAGANASIGVGAMSMFGSLASTSMGTAGTEVGATAGMVNSSMGLMGNIGSTGINSATSRENAQLGARTSTNIASMNNATSRNIADVQANTQSWIANMERDFAQGEANRSQMNTDINRSTIAELFKKLK